MDIFSMSLQAPHHKLPVMMASMCFLSMVEFTFSIEERPPDTVASSKRPPSEREIEINHKLFS